MAINLSPGDDAADQEQEVAGAPVTEGAETAPAPTEQVKDAATEGVTATDEQGVADATVADATEQTPVATDEQPSDSQPVEDDAHDLLDELEALIDRAHHFENAGIERLRAGGLSLIERIRNAI